MIELRHIALFLIVVMFGSLMYAITHDIFTVQKAGEFKATIIQEVQTWKK